MSKQAEVGYTPSTHVDFEGIAEESPDALFVFDRDFRYVYLNAAAERLLGRSRREVMGRVIWDEYPDLILTSMYQHYQRAMNERVPVSFEMPSQVRPGAWLEARITPYGDGGLLARARDITERKRNEEELAADASKQTRIAETLQRSLLLTPPSDTFPGLTVAALYEAAWDEAKIGGDFADIFAVDDRQVALVVGDVTGKGLAAASYTAEVKFALRAFIREYPGPAVTMRRLNDFLHDSIRLDRLSEGVFVALSLVLLDTETGAFICATAGMEPPLVVRGESGSVEELTDSGGPVLGAITDGEFDTVRAVLSAGDLLVMTTDGITEARRTENLSGNPADDFFGSDGLAQAAREARALPSLSALAQVLALRAKEFAGGRMRDDVCLLLARREPLR